MGLGLLSPTSRVTCSTDSQPGAPVVSSTSGKTFHEKIYKKDVEIH